MRNTFRLWVIGLALAAGACSTRGAGNVAEPAPEPIPKPVTTRHLTLEHFLAEPEGKYVVIDLEQFRLRFMDGATELWSATVGTGTGLRLHREEGGWEFSTPEGVHFVQGKEKDPVWFLPDWYFLENGQPIPPLDSPKRKQPGGLGVAAVFLGDEIAIHGTDKPELLGKRVSHGCIRLANADALRLFHNVQVGTPVLIVGTQEEVTDTVPVTEMARAKRAAKPKPKPAPKNPLPALSTAQLLKRLDAQLRADSGTAWTHTASELIARGIDDDAIALRGVLSRAGTAKRALVNREYDTFVADAFSRGPLRAVVSLARIDNEARERAAHAIVRATMDLFPGGLQEQTAPWPTRRVPSSRLGPDGTRGWQALQTAEAAYRAAAPPARMAANFHPAHR